MSLAVLSSIICDFFFLANRIALRFRAVHPSEALIKKPVPPRDGDNVRSILVGSDRRQWKEEDLGASANQRVLNRQISTRSPAPVAQLHSARTTQAQGY